MAIDFQNASGVAPNVNPVDGSALTNSATVDKSQFLNLLVEQLKNQDPTAPADQTQMLAQLAQFSSLEQMQNLNQTLTSSAGLSQISQSAALIGKTVTTAGTTASPGATGVVTSVSVQNNKPYLHIGNQDVDASTVTEIQ